MSKTDIRQLGMKNAIFNYIGKTLLMAIDAAIFIVVTKNLMVEDYGVYSFLMALLAFLAFFASLGIPYALLRFIPEYIEHNKKDTALSIIRLSLIAAGALGIILVIFGFFAADRVSVIFKIGALKRLLPLLMTTGALYIITRAQEGVLNALFMQPFRNGCQVVASLLKLVSFVFVLRYNLGVGWLLLSIAAISALQALVYSRRIAAYFQEARPQRIPRGELRRFCVFSVKEYLYVATAFFWDMSFDTYVIAYLLGVASVGIFSFASSISFFLLHWSPGIVLQPVISPLFVREYAKQNSAVSVEALFQFYNKCKAFFAFPVILGIWLLIDKFELIVYHNKFAGAVFALKILVVSVMLQAFTIPMRDIFNVFEKNEFSLYCNMVMVYRVAASFILIGHFGIEGAAYAYGTSMVLYFLMHLVFVRRIVKVVYPVRSFLKILANTLIMVLLIFAMRHFMEDNLTWLIITVAGGAAIYLFASYLNKPFGRKERGLINEAIGIPIWQF